ncbi:MAG TPA: hypothetical protein VGH89_08815 [Pseudonocardia sp.]
MTSSDPRLTSAVRYNECPVRCSRPEVFDPVIDFLAASRRRGVVGLAQGVRPSLVS